jgi:hypothetical protein
MDYVLQHQRNVESSMYKYFSFHGCIPRFGKPNLLRVYQESLIDTNSFRSSPDSTAYSSIAGLNKANNCRLGTK